VSWFKKLFGPSEAGPASQALAGERVLVADPSMTIQKVFELTLESQGCSVAFVASGDEAIQSLAGTPPTLVIASAELPGKSGYEVCEAVRRRPDLEGTIVVIMKGFGEQLDEGRPRRVGSDDVVTKPFEPGSLIERIRALRQKRPLKREG